MFTSRDYNENYFTQRNKIKEDFLREEEKETLEYIEEIENLVSNTKIALRGLISGEYNNALMKTKLEEIEKDLVDSCATLQNDIERLEEQDKAIEKSTLDLQKLEEEGIAEYLLKIEDVRKEIEEKEFKIQNMERLYVELENIIKENIRLGNDQLLTLEQFTEFISQNDHLKSEILQLEKEKMAKMEEYNNLLRENINLKSMDESFELEKVKEVLEAITQREGGEKGGKNEVLELQEKLKSINEECNELKEKIFAISTNLENLNIDSIKLNKEMFGIDKELLDEKSEMNKSVIVKEEKHEQWEKDLNRTAI